MPRSWRKGQGLCQGKNLILIKRFYITHTLGQTAFKIDNLAILESSPNLLIDIKADSRIRFCARIGSRALYLERRDNFKILFYGYFQIILKATFSYFRCQTSSVSPTALHHVRILPDPDWFSRSKIFIPQNFKISLRSRYRALDPNLAKNRILNTVFKTTFVCLVTSVRWVATNMPFSFTKAYTSSQITLAIMIQNLSRREINIKMTIKCKSVV